MNTRLFYSQAKLLRPLRVRLSTTLKQVIVSLPLRPWKRAAAMSARDNIIRMLLDEYSNAILVHQSEGDLESCMLRSRSEGFDFPAETSLGEWVLVLGQDIASSAFENQLDQVITLKPAQILDELRADCCVSALPDDIEWEITFSN